MGRNSISKIALKAMSIRLTIVVLLVALVGFWHNYKIVETRTLLELEKYVKERVERESIHFNIAKKNLEIFGEALEDQLSKNDRNFHQEFKEKFKLNSNGTYSPVEGDAPVQMFLKKGVTVTPLMEKTIVILNDLLLQFGHSWSSSFTNIWSSGVGDYGLTYWPSRQEALTNLPPDHSFLLYEYMAIGLPENNPRGEARWTGPYFDVMSKDWMISLNHPIYYQGKYLLSIGIDVLLNEFHQRSFSNVLEGTYNIIFREDGRLISHPKYMEKIKDAEGALYIQHQDDQVLKDIFNQVTGDTVLDDSKNDLFLGVGRITGPDWLFVLVYPKSNLTSVARETAIFLITVGFISLLIELLMLFHVIRKYVTEPIKKLIRASNKIATGEIGVRVEINSDDEIGHLAHSFNVMGDKVERRDKLLSDQAAQLEIQVQERGLELDVQRAKAFQAAKMATLGEIAGGIAHEINNPLGTITLNAGAIKKRIEKGHIEKDDVVPYLEKIESTSFRISKIVKGLRAFSRNAEHDTITATSLQMILEDTLTLCEETLIKNHVELKCDSVPAINLMCREVEIVQTLLNLIQNSIDAMASNEDKKIHISFRNEDKICSIVVEDNGPGIPREIVDKIMNPFFTTKDVGKGTGLGLFISCGLIESNGGKLTLEQETGSTRFVITLDKG
jgi:two-component system, NtrC family, sensor kinase